MTIKQREIRACKALLDTGVCNYIKKRPAFVIARKKRMYDDDKGPIEAVFYTRAEAVDYCIKNDNVFVILY